MVSFRVLTEPSQPKNQKKTTNENVVQPFLPICANNQAPQFFFRFLIRGGNALLRLRTPNRGHLHPFQGKFMGKPQEKHQSVSQRSRKNNQIQHWCLTTKSVTSPNNSYLSHLKFGNANLEHVSHKFCINHKPVQHKWGYRGGGEYLPTPTHHDTFGKRLKQMPH